MNDTLTHHPNGVAGGKVVRFKDTNEDSVTDTRGDIEKGNEAEAIEKIDENGNVGQLETSPGQKKSFKSIVQRHFIRDRVFYLVHDLLKTIEDEKKARNDLIDSFREARLNNTFEPLAQTPKRKDSFMKPKRRRRSSEVPLVERIAHARRNSVSIRENEEAGVASSERNLTIGMMELNANEPSTSGCQLNGDNMKSLKSIQENNGECTSSSNKNDTSGLKNIDTDGDRTTSTETLNHTETTTNAHAEQNSELTNAIKCSTGTQNNNEALEHKVEHTDDSNGTEEANTAPSAQTTKPTESQKHKFFFENGFLKKSTVPREIEEKMHSSKSIAAGEIEKMSAYFQSDIDPHKDEIDKMVLDSVLQNKESDTSASESDHSETDVSSGNEQQPVENKYVPEIISEQTVSVEVESDTDDSEDNDDSLDQSKVKVTGSDNEVKCSDTDDLDDHPESDDESKFKQLSDNNFYISSLQYTLNKQTASVQPKLDPIAEASHESFQSLPNSSGRESKSVIEILCKDSQRTDRGFSNNKFRKEVHLSNNYRSSKYKYKEHGRCKSQTNNGNSNYYKCNGSLEKHRNCERFVGQNNQLDRKRSKTPENTRKLLTIDLLGVYENNKDLQKIHKRGFKPRRHANKQVKIETNNEEKRPRSRSRSPRKRRTKEQRKYDMTPLPPKSTPVPLPKHLGPSLVRTKTDLSSCGSTSSGDTIESCKLFRLRTNEDRYRRPDHVIWNRLDMSEGKVGKDYGHSTGNRNAHFDDEDTWIHCNDELSNTCHNGRMPILPLKDAIKRVKSARKLPEMREISDARPRPERVGRLFIDLKNKRQRSAGVVEYRRFQTSSYGYYDADDDYTW